MSLGALLLLVAALGTGALALLQQQRTLHLLQLEHYENARMFVWLRRRGELVAVPSAPVRAALAIAAAVLALAGAPAWAVAVVAAALIGASIPEALEHLRRREIKPLVYTPRARRILGTALAPVILVLLAGLALSFLGGSVAAAICLLLVAAVTVAPALLTAAANRALAPWERRINGRFVARARATLEQVRPRVIGVTGSYGKTTTKVCIGAVLEQRDATLITPASFNSFLGVVRTINEQLRPEHRDFVVEMGMYRAGDIAELCALTHPRIGVITAIGPAHLERLGSIEAIRDAKAELAAALPAGGHLVTNGDDPRCIEIVERYAELSGVQPTLFGIANRGAHVRAENVHIDAGHTLFDLSIGNARTGVASQLLGEHNVRNLLAAAAVGTIAGLDIEQIRRGLEAVEPPEHRLQPLPNPGAGIVVIDDAYNSNPSGAAAALAVLRDHPARRRILVTPGMVELGPVEAEENEKFGALAAAACDRVILVGPQRTAPIRRGLERAGFDPAAIAVVRDIGEATSVLAGLTRAGDVVLFENDLPDMYAENDAPAAGTA